MRIISTIDDMVREREKLEGNVGFIPTMGYLHAGHLSLCRRARIENHSIIASIFVNPTQFGPQEDLERYPRNMERDLRLLEKEGVDIVFTPSVREIYPAGFTTYVEPAGPLVEEGEGAIRPGHFRGVATIVLKLFQIMQPSHAYFGQKDVQQITVIKRMISDFHLPISLRTIPTMRESDGLAMSSRNSYLDPTARQAATMLYQALLAGKAAFESKPTNGVQAVKQAMMDLLQNEPLLSVDYVELRDAETFLLLHTIQMPALLLIAVTIGQTRLIDNFVVHADSSWDTGLLIAPSNDV